MENERDSSTTPSTGRDSMSGLTGRDSLSGMESTERGMGGTSREGMDAAAGRGTFGQDAGIAGTGADRTAATGMGSGGTATRGTFAGEMGASGLGGTGLDQETDFSRPTPGGAGSGLGEDADDQPLTSRAREAASTARQRATERVQERIDDQKHRATDSLESVARSLRTAGEQMPDDSGMSRYMLQAASQVDNLASFLNNRELTELIDDVEDFARRQPAAFVGGAFALGVIGARFLKSSRRNLERQGREWDGDRPGVGFGDPRRDGFDSRTMDHRSSSGGTGRIDASPDFL